MQKANSGEMRPWCQERSKAGGEGNNRGQDGWMASPTQWTWIWEKPRNDEGQGKLACCSPWGRKELDATEQHTIKTGERNGNPLQYSCLENPMDRGAWQSMGVKRVGHNWGTEHAIKPEYNSEIHSHMYTQIMDESSSIIQSTNDAEPNVYQ